MHAVGTDTRVRITVSGVVQGVGFRPFVYNLASAHSLTGYVCNTNGCVEIEVQGPTSSITSFLGKLRCQAPPLALIDEIVTSSLEPEQNYRMQFEIRDSAFSELHQQRFIAPDTGTCSSCLSELFDPADRRFRYPFINCTDCGPRFTIIASLPYDRANTVMSGFTMCRLCQQEYDDPASRRFHAQPNACSNCGPSLSFAGSGAVTYDSSEALSLTLEQVEQGKIIAVKGLGGFHLICDASDNVAVNRLRQRKHRAKKPLALMMLNIDMIRQYCYCSEEEEAELTSARRSIVLLQKRIDVTLPNQIAAGIDRLGVMLPYTPLHHLLLSDYKKPLIATSANYSEEPIAIDNHEALSRLGGIADGFLLHNRTIQSRYDDSVVRFIDSKKTTLRRARGLAPLPIQLPFRASVEALACGAHLKNTICFVQNDKAFVSQYIGDLENVETLEHFEHTVNMFSQLFNFKPSLVGHDCHPDYLSTRFAQKLCLQQGLRRFEIQHHHAHIVSCMIEHGLTEPVIGVAFDGLGYGLDETLWGGEFLLASLGDFQRFAHLQQIPLAGGSQAIKRPWRMALSYVLTEPCENSDFAGFIEDLSIRHGKIALELVRKQIEQRLNSPLTSSCGRLFDAMAALLRVCDTADYDGQAAIELESLANLTTLTCAEQMTPYPFEFVGINQPFVIKTRSILDAAYQEYRKDVPGNIIAARFHQTIAHVILVSCLKIRQLTTNRTVCLSGGVFQNALLLHLVRRLLSAEGFDVFSPQEMPANDGGLSLGQAVIALAKAGAIGFPKL